MLEIGRTYTNGKLSRTITNMKNNEIYYTTEKGKQKQCWITTFQDWVIKGEKLKCELCSNIMPYETFKIGEQHEDIYYNDKKNVYMLALEQFRCEYSILEIKYCPLCGRKL